MVREQGSPAVGLAAGPEAMGQPAGAGPLGLRRQDAGPLAGPLGSEAMGSEASDLFTLVRSGGGFWDFRGSQMPRCRCPTLND